jgi:aldehyde dehydrogenase (NAD+)
VVAATRYIAPTILQEVDPFSPIMQEEIFGPLLPVLPIEDMDDAVAFVNARPKPLALYVFAEDGTISQEILRRTSSGGAVVNHVMMQLSVPDLPFGGVGESGMGAYHGKKSFDTFSHEKAVLERSTRFDPSLMYPPYTKQKRRWLRRLL